jgi:hypothetical protein
LLLYILNQLIQRYQVGFGFEITQIQKYSFWFRLFRNILFFYRD